MQQFILKARPFLVLILLIIFTGCGGDDDGPDPNPNPNPGPADRTAQDVINDFNNLEINEGTNDLELESLQKGDFWKFRLIVPEGASATNKRPLVLRLHGAARSGSPDAHLSTECLVEPGFQGKDVFILSPNSNGIFWYQEPNIVQVQALLDLVTSRFDVDKDKIVSMGYSDGGNGSWFFAEFNSLLFGDQFSASIPMASSYRNPPSGGDVSMIDVPLYVIHGTADDLFPIETTKGFVDEYVAAGSDITFAEAEGLVHNAPCSYVPYLREAVNWLETEVWD
ncbi:MAG: hypothetical protein JSV73_02565 [Flavobacteriaceae bacterium]|nr:MAG: hypothetical protein JSV73_02565 [Flavobacteriaceae bacterium]